MWQYNVKKIRNSEDTEDATVAAIIILFYKQQTLSKTCVIEQVTA
jgi:hypothetical protein